VGAVAQLRGYQYCIDTFNLDLKDKVTPPLSVIDWRIKMQGKE
jgi:hypothetical protein